MTRESFGCHCKAFRTIDAPAPDVAFMTLVRAADVTTMRIGPSQYVAWTVEERKYHVNCGQGAGGFCKHCLRAECRDMPWFQPLAEGARAVHAELEALRKAERRLTRENERLKKKIEKLTEQIKAKKEKEARCSTEQR